jgi:DNA-binding SARP family transcriptional activator
MLWFAVLGPLIVEDPIGTLSLAGAKERALLCLLLARANHVVPTEDLIQGLWGDEPPPTAEKSLQAHVVRLRDALEPDRPCGQSGSFILSRGPSPHRGSVNLRARRATEAGLCAECVRSGLQSPDGQTALVSGRSGSRRSTRRSPGRGR